MCGVIGIYLTNIQQSDLTLVENVFLESMIRGKHATGVTCLRDNELETYIEPLPAELFLENYKISQFTDKKNLKMIGHIRYSTSDLRYNQPFQGKDIAIAHNGVISQDPDNWEYKTVTKNDSELILRCIEAGDHPIEKYRDRSMAVVAIEDDTLHMFRNHERPLWIAELPNGIIAASTKDILKRAGVSGNIKRTEPLVQYSYSSHSGLVENRTYFDETLEDLQC